MISFLSHYYFTLLPLRNQVWRAHMLIYNCDSDFLISFSSIHFLGMRKHTSYRMLRHGTSWKAGLPSEVSFASCLWIFLHTSDTMSSISALTRLWQQSRA